MASVKSRKATMISILSFQTILIILFAIFTAYDHDTNPFTLPGARNFTVVDVQYTVFQDVHVMIFVGFGFLMTFLRKYAYSALGFTFLISALVIQWGLLCQGFYRMNSSDELVYLGIENLIGADMIAAAVLISLGAVLGKVSPIQLIIMAIIETIFYTFNEYLGTYILDAVDPGGSMYIHVFGAYFGLAVSFSLPKSVSTQEEKNYYESSTYQSDVNAMIGSLFLWIFWPSFNAGFLYNDEKYRAIINTYLSLTASCLAAFAVSSMINKNAKFNMVHIQNATLAGGVCVGTSANMMIQPYGALVIGCFGGTLSTLGFCFVQDKLRIHDTCGVHNLHGMPGMAAGIIGAIVALIANYETYELSLFEVFPALSSPSKRTVLQQAGYQFLALTLSFLNAVIGGLITGVCIRNFKKIERYFDDEIIWNLPSSEKNSVNEESLFRVKI